jgi:hypothetical protein
MRVIATHEATVRRDWLCRHCSHWGHATVRARGKGERRVWLSRATAADRAHEAASEAPERIRGLIRCPRCQRRAPHAVAWSIARLAPLLLFALLVANSVAVTCALRWSHGLWTAPIFIAIAVAVASHSERRRWRQARHADLEVGAPPAPRPAGPGPVSVPLAGDPFRTPPVSPMIPVVTTRAEPAAPIVPGDPADKPKFLV